MSKSAPIGAVSPVGADGKQRRRNKRSRKEAAMQVRESGWASTSVASSRGWGEYNAFQDQHCPWALALKHNLHGSARSAAMLNGKTVGDAKIKADHGVKETILSMTEPISLDRWTLPTMQKSPKPGEQQAGSSRGSSRGGSRRGRRKDEPAADSVVRKVAKTPLRGGAGLPNWENVYGTEHIRPDTAVQDAALGAAAARRRTEPQDDGSPRHGGMGKSGPTLSDGTSVYDAANAGPVNVSWQESISGGAEVAAEVELTCLRCVVRREALLADVAQALGLAVVTGATTNARAGDFGDEALNEPPNDTVLLGLFAGLREAAMDVAEAIVAWRRSPTVGAGGVSNTGGSTSGEGARIGTANRTFMHRHENYLLKMVSDTDFLAESPAAKAVLAKRNIRMLRGNPFIMPTELAGRITALQKPASQAENELALKMHCDPLRLRDAERTVLDEARRLAVILDEEESKRLRRQQERQAKEQEQLELSEMARAKSPHLEPLSTEESKQSGKDGAGVTIVGGHVFVNPRSAGEDGGKTVTFGENNRGAGDKNAGKFGGNSNYERAWTSRPLAKEDQLVARLKELKMEIADRQQGIGEIAAELVLKRTNVGRLEETITGLTRALRAARAAHADKNARSLATRIKVAGAEREVANKDLREARATLCLEELEVRRVMALVRTINQQLKDERERKRLERERRAEERRRKREMATCAIQRRMRGVLARKRTVPKILERRAAAEEIARIARERQARLEAKLEADRRRMRRDAARAIQKIARGRLVRTGLQARAEAAAEVKAMTAAAAEASAVASAAAAEARATAMALHKGGHDEHCGDVSEAERVAIVDEEIAEDKASVLAEDRRLLREVQNQSPIEALEARHRKTPSPSNAWSRAPSKAAPDSISPWADDLRDPAAPSSAGPPIDSVIPRFTSTPVGPLPATPIRPGSSSSTGNSQQVFGGRNVRALTPEVKEGMKRKIENAIGNPRLYKYFLVTAIENKLPTDAGLQNDEKQRLSVESAEHHMFLDRIATPLDSNQSRPSTMEAGGVQRISTSMAPLFADGDIDAIEENGSSQGAITSGRIVTPIMEVKIDPAVAGRISGIDETTAQVAGEAAATDLRLRLSSSFIAASNELWWTVDVIDTTDPTDEAASRMYRVDMRPWQLAENGLDELATIGDLETDEQRNSIIDKLLVFLVNQQRNISRQQQQQVSKHLQAVGEEASQEFEDPAIAEQTRKVWNKMSDPATGYMYYVNELTGLCQWTTPTAAELEETYSAVKRAVNAKLNLQKKASDEKKAIANDPKARAAAKEAEAAAEKERQDFAKKIVELEQPAYQDRGGAGSDAVADPRSLLQQLAVERQRRAEVEKALKEAEEAAAKLVIPQVPWECGICKRNNEAGVGKCVTCGAAPGRVAKQSSEAVNAEIAEAKSEAEELRKALAVQQLQSDAAKEVERAASAAAQGVERSIHTAERRRSRSPLKSPEYAAMRSGLERLQRDLRQQDRQQASHRRSRPRSRALSSDDGLAAGGAYEGGDDKPRLQRARTQGGDAIVSRLENEQRLFSERMSLLVRQIRSMLGEDEDLEEEEDDVMEVGVTFEDDAELDRLEAEEGLNVDGGEGPFFGGGDVGDFGQEWDGGQRDALTPLTPGTDRSDVGWAGGRGGSRDMRRSKSEGSDRSGLSSGPRAQSADSDMAVVPRARRLGTNAEGDDEPLEIVLASQVEMSESVLILLQQLQDMDAVTDGGDKGKAAAGQGRDRRRSEGRSEGRPYTSPAQMSRPAHRTSLDTVPVPHDVRANSRGGTSEILFIVDSPFGPDGTYDERQGSGDWRNIDAPLMELDERVQAARNRPASFQSGGGLYSRTMFPKLSTIAALLENAQAKEGADESQQQFGDVSMTNQSISLAHNPTLGALDKSSNSIRPLFGYAESHNENAAQLLPKGTNPPIDPARGPIDAAAAAAARALFADETAMLSARGIIEVAQGGEYEVEPETGVGLWWNESKATPIDTKLDLSSIVAYRERKLEAALRAEASGKDPTAEEYDEEEGVVLDTSRSTQAAAAAEAAALEAKGQLEESQTVRVSNEAKNETQDLLLNTAKRAQTYLELLAVVKGLKLKPTTASMKRREKRMEEIAAAEDAGTLPKADNLLKVGTEHRGLVVEASFPLGRSGVAGLQQSGGQLVVSRGHISTFDGDAIVNAADQACMGGGDPAIDGVLKELGGPDLHVARKRLPVLDKVAPPAGRKSEEKSDLVSIRCRRGTAVLTVGGSLDTKYVIHAVGPNYLDYEPAREREGMPLYEGGVKAGDQILTDATRAALGVARDAPLPKEEGGSGIQLLSSIRSLAVAPLSLSTNLRGPKRDLYTLVELQVRAVLAEVTGRDTATGEPYTAIQEVHLVGSNDEEVQAMVAAADKVFGELIAEAHATAVRAQREAAAAATAATTGDVEESKPGFGISRTSISINTPVKEPQSNEKKKKTTPVKKEVGPTKPTKWTQKTVEAASIVRSPTMMRLALPRNMLPEIMSQLGIEVGKHGTANMVPVHVLEAKARAFTYLTHQTSRYECGLWLRMQGRLARGMPAEETPEAMAAYEAKLEALRPRTLLELAMEGAPSVALASPNNVTTREDTPPPEGEDEGDGDDIVEVARDRTAGSFESQGISASLEGSITQSYEGSRSKASTVISVSNADIETTFRRYDREQRGRLDTFELGAAIEEITGRKLSYKELAHVVSLYNLGQTNSVTLDAFALLVRERDWASADDLRSQEDCYDVDFAKKTLGFRVRTVQERGVIVVNRIVDVANYGRVGLGDVVLAVNGAPLGWVQAHTELADAVRNLPRPVRLTFRRGTNAWTGLPDVQWNEAQLSELFRKYARAAEADLPLGPFSEHLGAEGKEPVPLHIRNAVKPKEVPMSEVDLLLPGRKLTQKELDERAAKEKAAAEAAEKAAKEAEDAYRVEVTDWVMDVFCLEPALSEIYGRPIPTVNISEMVLQLRTPDGRDRAVLEVADFIYIARNLIVNDLHERDPIEIGPGKLMPQGKLHPSAKALFIPWNIETSVPPSPVIQQLEDGFYAGIGAQSVNNTLSLVSSSIEDHIDAGGSIAKRAPPAEYYEVIFRAISLGFRICNAARPKGDAQASEEGEQAAMVAAENSMLTDSFVESLEEFDDEDRNDLIEDNQLPLEVLVKDVPDEDLAQFVGVADSVVAINGAPLGRVTDHKTLAARIGSLSRPIRITFRRNNPEVGVRALWIGNNMRNGEAVQGAEDFDMKSIASIESTQLGEHEESMWHDGDPKPPVGPAL